MFPLRGDVLKGLCPPAVRHTGEAPLHLVGRKAINIARVRSEFFSRSEKRTIATGANYYYIRAITVKKFPEDSAGSSHKVNRSLQL